MNRFYPFLIVPLLLIGGLVSGDGCMIPYEDFDVYEPGQKAIIAWNGTHEKMILSVDSHSTGDTKALHIVPFPSVPEMELGSSDSFKKVEEILNRKDTWVKEQESNDGDHDSMIPPVEIIHHEKIGPHDLTVTRVNSWQNFSKWVTQFLEEKGVTNVIFPEKTDMVVKNYIENNITCFTLDVVELTKDTKTVDPIIYSFTTERLYFPLEISSLLKGDSTISLALLTPPDKVLNSSQMNELGFELIRATGLSSEEIEDIDESIHELLEEGGYLSFFEGNFDLESLSDNVKLTFFNNVEWTYNIQEIRYGGSTDSFAYVYDREKIALLDIETGDLLFEWKPSDGDGLVYFQMIEEVLIGSETHVLIQGIYSGGDFIALLDVTGTQVWFNRYDGDKKRIRFINTCDNNVTVVRYGNDENSVLMVLNISSGKETMAKTMPYQYPRAIQQLETGLFLDSEEHFYLLSLRDGSTIWDVKKSGANHTFVYRFNDMDGDELEEIFLYTYNWGNNTISTLDMENGEETILIERSDERYIPIAFEKGLLILKSNRYLGAYDIVRGEFIWDYFFPEEYMLENSCYFEMASMIVLYHRGSIVGLNASTGEVEWKNHYPVAEKNEYGLSRLHPISTRPGDENILVEMSGRILTLDIDDGTEVWNFSVDSDLRVYGIIEEDGADSILMKRAGGIFSFRYEPNEMDTIWPHSYVYEDMEERKEDTGVIEEERGISTAVSVSVFIVILVMFIVILVEMRR